MKTLFHHSSKYFTPSHFTEVRKLITHRTAEVHQVLKSKRNSYYEFLYSLHRQAYTHVPMKNRVKTSKLFILICVISAQLKVLFLQYIKNINKRILDHQMCSETNKSTGYVVSASRTSNLKQQYLEHKQNQL